MKTLIIVAACICLLLVSSCLPKEDSCSYQVKIPFTEFNLPDTVSVNVPVQINATTQTPDDCWDASFHLNKDNSMEYSVHVIGNYVCDEQCFPEETEYDTTFVITPTQTGNVIFHISQSAQVTRHDTMYVE